jgi:SAM-dependent methyltransferase
MGKAQPVKEGWFHTKNRLGDRTIEQQMLGLDLLMQSCKGKTALDVGCAEGLISIRLAQAGAIAVHGIEIVARHVEVGNRLRKSLPITFEVQDANDWKPKRQYDIVIALALLHKLRDPSAACARFAAAAREMVVLRLPPGPAPLIIDDRSGRVPHDTAAVMGASGFELIQEAYDGPFDEYVSYWKRRKEK